MTRPELSYDGKGINGPDEYRTRLFTARRAETREEYAELDRYGRMFEAAPAMLAALEEARGLLAEVADYADEMRRIGRGPSLTGTTGATLEHTATMIRAAIAAARGEE